MRQGMILNDSGDIKLQVVRDASGLIIRGLAIGESDSDHISLIVSSNKGEFKEYPVLGVGEQYLKSVGRISEMRSDIQTQLELDGYKANVQVSNTGKLVIDVD